MNSEPIILAIETALGNGSLSLFRGNKEIAAFKGEAKVSRAEDLLQLISAILKKNNLSLRRIDLIAVSEGPGSFTGIRIGISTAQALALGSNRPLFGISVLDALAFSADFNQVVSVVSTGRNLFVWQKFDEFISDEKSKYKPQIGNLEEIIKMMQNPKPDFSRVVFESKARQQIEASDLSALNNAEIINASDNVAGIIAQYAFFLLNKGVVHKPLSPEYLSDAVLEKKIT